MPLILEQISTLNAEDRQDLLKIYADDPEIDSDQLEPWLEAQLANKQLLLAGRFNGRLLTAIFATTNDQQWQLNHLCVRELTRRRSVARQLLQLICKQADSQQRQLTVANNQRSKVIEPLLVELNFTGNQHGWLRKPHPTGASNSDH